MKLYHATYAPRLKSIMTFGLGAKRKKNWEDSNPNVVYLADDPYIAESYAEEAELVSEDYLNQIVILEIDSEDLDSELLETDSNVIDGENTYEYWGIVPPEYLEIYKD